ncbi:reverse transcriptase domain-containing protein [Tanacetum coccineum]
MKLNPKKCTFGVESGQFLGYMITNEGIKANPKKVQAIIDLASPKSLRDVQALNGKLAALGRYLTPWLRCVNPEEADYVLREVHFGSCGAHAGARSIAQKVARLGYYSPNMYNDPSKLVDIVGPFPEAPGIIISDNGKQFANNPFKEWCEELKIKQHFTSIAHPQSNRQTEVTNRTLVQARTRKGCTPFNLVYGSEAVLPTEIGLPTYRIKTFNPLANDANIFLNLELLEERREMAALRAVEYRTSTERYYNRRVKHKVLKIGDFVLQKNEASRQEGQRKLDPKWEGPYQITIVKQKGTYTLADMKGHPIPLTWHISNLRKFKF